MRKKCVRWTTSAFACALAAAALWAVQTKTSSAQAHDPSTLPLLTADQLVYLGGFRLPRTSSNGADFGYGGKMLTYNPAKNSLFVSNKDGGVAEVTIPNVVKSPDINALGFAGYLQPFTDLTEGRLGEVGNNVALDSIMLFGNRLYGTAYIYYDANNVQRVSHYSHSAQLNEPSFSGWSQVWDAGRQGYVAGPLAVVPSEWQGVLGAAALTGQCCIPIVSRTSVGPAAFGFDPNQIGQSVVPATPLVYYTSDHATLGPWAGANPVYGASTFMGGMIVIPGTRTVLYVGSNGMGANCYGEATTDPAKHLTTGEHGLLCYDLAIPAKAPHAYPYRSQIWAYDLNDLAEVKAGRKQPWDVVPYGVWPLTFPISDPTAWMGGMGYDAQRKVLYMSQMRADRDGYALRPIIQAFRIGAGGAPEAPDTPEDVVSSVVLGADKTAPQQPGVDISFLAVPEGGTAPHQYKWTLNDGTTTTVAGDWGTNNRYTWTAGADNPNYSVTVSVRSNGNTGDAEATASMPFAIAGRIKADMRKPTGRVTAVALTPDKAAPQRAGTAIIWSATPSGGVAPHQYRWWIYDGANWTNVREWSPDNTFTWTPATPNAAYRVSVWVRSAGNTNDWQEYSTEVPFAIDANAPARATAVTLTADRPAPQLPGTTMTWTATPTGGTAPHSYRWWIYNGSTWTNVKEWSAGNTFTWTPATANAGYRVSVWVRSAGNPNDWQEVSTERPFAIAAPVSAVTLSADKVAPQGPGTTIKWTAAGTGGIGPLQYKWLVSAGAGWTVAANWSTSQTFNWTPATANPNARVSVWVRSATSTDDVQEAVAETPFAIEAARATAVSLIANQPAPQMAGSAITWTATPTGGTAPFQYRWWIFDGSNWTNVKEWSTPNTFTWTPATANAAYRVSVWVRSAGNLNDWQEVSTETPFAIAAPVSAVMLSANKTSPQIAGNSVNWSAAATGGIGPLQYKWLVYDGTTVYLAANWSTSSTLTWTPTTASANYRVAVRVRSATNSADVQEAGAESPFAIQPVPVLAPPPTPTGRATAVTLTPSVAAPQLPGTPITWTATPTGGVAPYQYRWWIYDGTRWTNVKEWSSANTFTWTPATANADYRVSVWVRSAGNSNDWQEVSTEVLYPVDPN